MKYQIRAGVITPFVQKYYKLLILAIAGLFTLSYMVMTLTASAKQAPNWVLQSGSQISFSCGGGTYVHTIDTVTAGIGGNFSGAGHYNTNPGYTWDIDGEIIGDSFEFTIVYTGIASGSVYNATNGAINPDGSAAATADSNCQSLTLKTNSFTPYSIPEDVVDVYGNTVDTSLGENGSEGWWFNRDTTTSSPSDFRKTMPSIGEGSLYVKPIGSNASDKFIAENFVFDQMGSVDSFSYDFKIGSGGVEADRVHFYLNVYANFNESGPTKFYDCRYNIVPSVGSTSGYTTVLFNPEQNYSVATRGSSPYPCPSSPADMGDDAYIRVFAINVGDTSTNDVGLDGYLDNVVYRTTSEQTTYDFEQYPRSAEITAPASNVVVSGSVDFAAYLNDDDADNIQWAIRQGTCAAGTNTVFGNVDGKTNVATINQDKLSMQTFDFTADMTGQADGMYCLIYNPVEDSGESNIRLTREFTLFNLDTKEECKNEGWMQGLPSGETFRNQGDCMSYFATSERNPATNGVTNERANNKKNN